MVASLLNTDGEWILTVVRIVLGIIFFAHGAQKLLGWFGGAGYTQTMRVLREQFRLPLLVALFAILVEFFGGFCLIIGFISRPAALGLAAMLLGAIATAHYRYGLFLNWFGEKSGHGFEYHLLAIALAMIVVVKGSGALSVDRILYEHVKSSSQAALANQISLLT